MPDGREAITVKVLSSIHEVDANAWDDCAGDGNPFTAHAFLSALEDSGSATAETGWMAQHLTVSEPSGDLLAAAPLYLKNHSYGEYVFDWGWADAFQRAGGQYYPKLQCSVPFTPASGRRLLVRPDLAPDMQDELHGALAGAMMQLSERLGASSAHVTFPSKTEWQHLGRAGFLLRTGLQYHWQNHGYADFDEFLGALTSRKRKQIRKERRQVAQTGLTIRALSGPEIEPRHWDAFHRFYRSTTDKKWGSNYLTREFFPLLGQRLGEKVVLIVAEDGERPVAGALNLVGRDTLFGRNWGCDQEYKFLHFEACYYQALDYAIAHGLSWVEAGAQGPHKVQRGYLPQRTYSAHWIEHPGLRDAVEDFVTRERREIDREMALVARHSPYRAEDPE